jgi:hypothetical protein
VDGGVPAEGGGPGSGLNGFGVLAAGLAEVGVDVHHAGQCHQAGGVDDGGAVSRQPGSGFGDDAVADQQVRRLAAQD